MADIELVIRMPENYYNQIKSTDDFYLSAEEKLVKRGTPLPKGHGRLKDVDHYIKMQWEHPDYSLIDDEPTIIEADKEQNE